MSELSGDSTAGGEVGSFWEPGQYRRTTKRIDDGHRLCDDLSKLVTERAEIEKNYAKNLHAWSKKWSEIIDKGPEYGSAADAWRAALQEAERRCELHLAVRDSLVNDVRGKVKQWQKDNYHRSVVYFRERKEKDDAFKRAQKPWVKLLQKVNKSKVDYHLACRNQRSAAIQEKNASHDTELSTEAMKKLSERVQKAGDDLNRTKSRYESALNDLNTYNGKYIEEMNCVFEQCQEMEACRHIFFQQRLLDLQKYLNLSADPTVAQIYMDFEATVRAADKDDDLRWWSNNHGTNMTMNWPVFEEYTEEVREITSRRCKKSSFANGNIILINQRPLCDDWTNCSTMSHIKSNDTKLKSRSSSDIPRQVVNSVSKSRRQMSGDSANPSTTNSNDSGGGCWEEEDDDDDADNDVTVCDPAATVPSGAKLAPVVGGLASAAPAPEDTEGVPVRALYDYTANEDDELSFCVGDCLLKLGEEDDQGWCRGQLQGRVGLYPANYVELI